MNRGSFVGTLGLGLLAAPLAAAAQQAGAVPKIGVLWPGSPTDVTMRSRPSPLLT